jgi:hypothetical protein
MHLWDYAYFLEKVKMFGMHGIKQLFSLWYLFVVNYDHVSLKLESQMFFSSHLSFSSKMRDIFL